MERMTKTLTGAGFLTALMTVAFAQSQTAGTPQTATQPPSVRGTRPPPPTRDPKTPGYVTASELPDGAVPSPGADGNFITGPTHNPAPETTAQDGVPQGTIYTFTMSSADSKIYPGVARDQGTFGTVDPDDPAKLVVTTSHPAPYTRRVSVYVPKQYVPDTAAPFIVGATDPVRWRSPFLTNRLQQSGRRWRSRPPLGTAAAQPRASHR